VTAQVSLYPLRQQALSPAIEEACKALEEHGLEHQVSLMSTLVWGEVGEVFAALKEAFERAAQYGGTVMVVTISNACPLPKADERGCAIASKPSLKLYQRCFRHRRVARGDSGWRSHLTKSAYCGKLIIEHVNTARGAWRARLRGGPGWQIADSRWQIALTVYEPSAISHRPSANASTLGT